MNRPDILWIYNRLMDAYGPQGWWPLLDIDGINPTKTGAIRGYHPGEYDYPRTELQRFEICVGAILTQNTAWPNVEKALIALGEHVGLHPKAILDASQTDVENAIRPSGYFRMKTEKLAEFSAFFLNLDGQVPTRKSLLQVWGIGPETADSMRLYAYKQLEMVCDAYTTRILRHLGLVGPKAGYEEVKRRCVEDLPADLVVYQEFHALVVEHAKRTYRRKPYEDQLLGSKGL